jgi:hypothetical protein
MAYPYICEPCLEERHDKCQVEKDVPPKGSGIYGGGFCVCSHGDNPDKFEKSVREHYK